MQEKGLSAECPSWDISCSAVQTYKDTMEQEEEEKDKNEEEAVVDSISK